MEILTSEQQAQIPKIQKKWREIVFSTEPIDRAKAERAVRLAYAALEEKLPPIVFCTSPEDAFQKLANSAYSTKGNQKRIEGMAKRIEQVLSQQLRSELVGQLNVKEVNELVEELARLLADEMGIKVRKMAIAPTSPGKKLSKQLEFQINSQVEREGRKKLVRELKLIADEEASKLEKQLCNRLKRALLNKVLQEIESLLEKDLDRPFWRKVINGMESILWKEIDRKYEDIDFPLWDDSASYFDCGFSVLKCVGNRKSWSALQSLVKDCGWIYAMSETCFVCDRPRRIAIDKQKRIRGAIRFADGYKISLDESAEFKQVAVASNNRKAVPGRKVASSRGDRGDRSSLLTKKVGLLNKIVGIIIYIVMSLPLAIVWILLIIPRLSVNGISSIVSYILQGILLIRGRSLTPSFSQKFTRSRGDRWHQSSWLKKMVGLLNNIVGRIIYIVMSLPLSIPRMVRMIPRWSVRGIFSICSYILQGIWLIRDVRLRQRLNRQLTRRIWGVALPAKYSKINPDKWRSQWILKERNAELRRVLIQEIGYDRIARELSSKTLDSWQEYTLLRIAYNIDVEPILLLKMTCPSTGHIHALRVPPDMRSAREAIRWVNGGIDPEEFSVAT